MHEPEQQPTDSAELIPQSRSTEEPGQPSAANPQAAANTSERTANFNDSDKHAIAIACLGAIPGFLLFLVEKTPLMVIFCAVAIFALWVYPILHFVPGKLVKQITILALAACVLIGLGWAVWPREKKEVVVSNPPPRGSPQPPLTHPSPPATPNNEVQRRTPATAANEIKTIIVQHLQVDEAQVTPDADLMMDLGADPLDKVEIAMQIETEYGIHIPDQDRRKLKTVGDFINYVERREHTQKPRPPKPNTVHEGVTLGNDSIGYGHLPAGTKIGDRSVYVGPTDEHGNVRIPGGTAVGDGAKAGPNGVALGAHANAGGTLPQKQQTCEAGSICNQDSTVQAPQTIYNNVPQPLKISLEGPYPAKTPDTSTSPASYTSVLFIHTNTEWSNVSFGWRCDGFASSFEPEAPEIHQLYETNGMHVSWEYPPITPKRPMKIIIKSSQPVTKCFINPDDAR